VRNVLRRFAGRLGARNWRDVLRVKRNSTVKKGGTFANWNYTTDDLRQLYQATNDDPIRLRDGIVSRMPLVAVIRSRIFWAKSSYILLLIVSVLAAGAAVFAAAEGWRH
jgi:hypothetical protein